MRTSFAICSRLLLLFAVSLWAEEPAKPKDREFTADELELIRMCDDWQTAVNTWYQESQEFKDEEKQREFLQGKLDSAPLIPQLISFEKAHHGTFVGLMATRRLTHLGMTAYRPDSLEYQAWSHVLDAVCDYGEHAELTDIVRFFEFSPLPETEGALSKLIAKESGVSANNRDFAKYALASWVLHQRDSSEYLRKWLADVDAQRVDAPQWHRDSNAAQFKAMVPPDKLSSLVPEAVDILEKLVASTTDARRVVAKSVNNSRYILEADADATERLMPRVQDMASGLLFKERHLQVGKPAPDVTVKLVSGEDFAFSQQRGKVLVVQFSFTGCGPCEATYPTLKELTAKYPDRLTVITFMRDVEPDDAKAAASSGKMTWNVSWDGMPGTHATGWGVLGYPTIYVFGTDGLLVERQLSWGHLQEKVELLLK